MFHKEGHSIILITFFLVSIAAVTVNFTIENFMLKSGIFAGLIVLLVLVLQFFRNPKVEVNINPNHIIAPVDGKVVIVKEVQENEVFKDKRLQISIFMSPLNVHVTRYPAGGVISYSKYHKGKYLLAWHPKSSEKNERTSVVIQNPVFGKVLYRQIAGTVARRIVNYAKPSKVVMQGDESGFIKFGSRLDVFLPPDTEITVNLKQKVKGGKTTIAVKSERF